jgi:hypothetical protein
MTRAFGAAILALSTVLLAGCASPLYVWDTHTSSTPRSPSLEVAELRRQPVAILGLVAPAALQGFSASLSHALARTLPEVSPPLHGIVPTEVVNVVNAQGLAAEYSDLVAGFGRGGILERERLQRLGSALGCRYVLLPGLAAFDHALFDKFEFAGIKLIRTRVLVLRLWLQLWDARTGHLVWEAAGEATVTSQLVDTRRIIPLDEVAEKVWLRMVQDGLLAGRRSSHRTAPCETC